MNGTYRNMYIRSGVVKALQEKNIKLTSELVNNLLEEYIKNN